MAAKNRQCTTCGVAKPIEELPLHGKGDYRKRICLTCNTAKQQSYKSATPEAYLYSRLFNKSRKAEVSITKEDLRAMWDAQQGKCAVTGMHMTYYPRRMRDSTGLNASVDRVDQSKGYERGNVRLVCYRVNLMRHAGEDADLLWWCKQIIEGIEGE